MVDQVPWGDEWDRVVDVVVVGCGAAGATAAVVAADRGAEVLVLEKNPVIGGTTASSGGQMWIPDNPVMRDRGQRDERDAALQYMVRTAYPALYTPDDRTLGVPVDRYRLIEAFFDHAGEAVAFLQASGAVTLEPVDYPDYYAHLPEDAVGMGRTLAPVLPDGWQLGVDPPGGQLLVEDLMACAGSRGASLETGQRVVQVVRNPDGAVVGVVTHVGRRTELVGARQGVVFASGGFLHDPQLALDHLKGPVFGGAANPAATGDFVRIAQETGTRFANMAHAWWDQVVVEVALRRRATSSDVYSPFGDSMLMVNRHGRRVVNEKAPYNERAQAHFAWDPYRGEYPNLLLFMVFDDAVVGSDEVSIFRWPVPRADSRPRDYVLTADTLEGLADRLRDRLADLAAHTGRTELDESFVSNLHDTVAGFNHMAIAGRDTDFHRGETPIEQVWAGPARGDAPSGAMHPLSDDGPYHCIILGPGALDTKGGPATDEHARVLDPQGVPIAGLYGAGNCVASPAGQAYWGPGGTIGLAVAFGYLAGAHAVEQPRRRPD